MTATHDIALLMAALDAGDDTALLALADAMEEAGDGRHAGLRTAIRQGNVPGNVCMSRDHFLGWGWQLGSGHGWSVPLKVAVQLDVLGRLRRADRWGDWRIYPSRSSAFIALAEALS